MLIGNSPSDSQKVIQLNAKLAEQQPNSKVNPFLVSKTSRKRSRSINPLPATPASPSNHSIFKPPSKRSRTAKRSRSITSSPVSASNQVSIQPFWEQGVSNQLSQRLWLYDSKTVKAMHMELDLTSALSLPTSPFKGASVSNASSWFTAKTYVSETGKASSSWSQPLWKVLKESISSACTPPKRHRISKTNQGIAISTDPLKPLPFKVKKIRMYPTREQREKLIQWIGGARWVWNKCLDLIYNHGAGRNQGELRRLCIHNSNFIGNTDLEWMLEIPYEIRDEAMRDLLKAFKSCSAKGDRFTIKYRRKKDKKQNIVIQHRKWACKTGFYSFLKDIKLSEELEKMPNHDTRIIKNKLDQYYLCLPEQLKVWIPFFMNQISLWYEI